MNVTCTGCPAKYAVPDEKVRGKKVRITCKHCGTNIIVDGTASAAGSEASAKPAAQPTATSVKAEAKQPAQVKVTVAEPTYIVGFADDRQETHSISRIVEMYGAGKIDDETLVWKDGMADWLSPFDVPELAAAFRAKNVAPRAQAPTVPAFSPVAEDEATLVVKSPLDDPEVAAAIAASAPSVPPAAAAAPEPAFVAPKPVEEEPTFARPAAARRSEKRGGAVDLFGKVAEAGSEGDVSLDLGPSEERGQKLTGARNESSVLFSLDALTKGETKASPAKAKEQEREAEALFGESASSSLMNLGAGMSAMAAPDFTKPVIPGAKVVPLGNEPAEEPPSKGRGGVIALVAVLAIAAAAGVAFVVMKKQPLSAEPTPATPSAAARVTTSAEPAASEAPASSAAPTASAAPGTGASAAANASAAPAGSSSAAASAAPAGAKPTTATTPATPAAAAATPAAPAAAAAAKPADAAAAAKPADAPAAPAAPAAAEAAAFDKNAAVAALSAAAASAASCKTADGPTGSGKVSVTFAPSGRATATSVAGELAGTEVGGCVARVFRSAKVPPFSGDPVTVSKSFTIQ